jgi:DNA modification methylase
MGGWIHRLVVVRAVPMTVRVLEGDCREMLRGLPDRSVHCVVTSPPYFGLRSYLPADHPAKAAEMGSETSPLEFVQALVGVFREVRRVLRDDGTVFLNLGDSYVSSAARAPRAVSLGSAHPHSTKAPLKPKDLMMMPARVAIALQDDGWYVRRDIIWHKPAVMPESVTDRCTTAHEYLFHISKCETYSYDAEAIMEPTSSDSHARAKRGRSSTHKYADGGPGKQTIAGGRPSAGRLVAMPGVNPKAGGAPIGEGVKQNASFSAAVTQLVAMRNKRSVWTILVEPYKGAHFATMPPGLAEPCILAGTSAHGCCPGCGAPWERIVEKGEPDLEAQRAAGGDLMGGYTGQSTKGHDAAGVQNASDVKRRILAGMLHRKTVGWRQTCSCAEKPAVPCVVLDPFGGAGTTGLVADRLGRDAVLIELNPDSARQARERIAGEAGMFAAIA